MIEGGGRGYRSFRSSQLAGFYRKTIVFPARRHAVRIMGQFALLSVGSDRVRNLSDPPLVVLVISRPRSAQKLLPQNWQRRRRWRPGSGDSFTGASRTRRLRSHTESFGFSVRTRQPSPCRSLCRRQIGKKVMVGRKLLRKLAKKRKRPGTEK